jgi:hypothetical protein
MDKPLIDCLTNETAEGAQQDGAQSLLRHAEKNQDAKPVPGSAHGASTKIQQGERIQRAETTSPTYPWRKNIRTLCGVSEKRDWTATSARAVAQMAQSEQMSSAEARENPAPHLRRLPILPQMASTFYKPLQPDESPEREKNIGLLLVSRTGTPTFLAETAEKPPTCGWKIWKDGKMDSQKPAQTWDAIDKGPPSR